MDSNEKWYSVKEVAGVFEVSCDSVRRWIMRGKLRAFLMPGQSSRRKRIYQSFRISESELARFIRSQMTA